MVDLNSRTVDGETDLTVNNLDVDLTTIFDGPVYFNSTVSLPGSISLTNISCTTLDVSSTTTLPSLAPSSSVQTNASSQLTSITNTGSGSNVLAVSPTLTTPNLGAAAATSLSLTTALSPSDGGTGQTSLAAVTVGNATNAVNAVSATTATSAATAGSAATATSVSGGATGDVVVQTGVGATGFVSPGTSGQVLTSNGAGVGSSFQAIPATNLATGVTGTLGVGNGGTGQTSLSAVTVGNATNAVSAASATTSLNVSAGAAGDVVVQSGVGVTGFVSPGTSGRVLTSNGAGVATSFQAIPATNLATGVTGTLGASNGGTGQTSLSAVTVGNATAAVTSTNVAGGTTGSLVYQTGVGATGFIAGGTAGQVLTANGVGVAPSYQASGGGSTSGSWTPTVTTNATFSGNLPCAGYWQNIGNMCFIHAEFYTFATIATASGSVLKFNLDPAMFTATGNPSIRAYGICAFEYFDSYVKPERCYLEPGNQYLLFNYENVSSGPTEYFQNNTVADTRRITVSLFYRHA